MLKKNKDKNTDTDEFLMTNGASFWNQRNKLTKKKEFKEALTRIKQRDELNAIDKRLLQIIDNFGS